jgi:hypothetical protein
MSSDERPRRLVREFHVIMDSIVGLPTKDIEGVEELVQVGEWVVALENLCTQLYEYDIDLPTETLKLIEVLGRDIGMAARYWRVLAPTGSETEP